MADMEIEGTMQERRLYDLIWKRTIASQMAEAEIEKTTVTIDIDGQAANFNVVERKANSEQGGTTSGRFIANGEIVEQLKNDMSSRINKSGRVIGTGMLIHS